MSEGVGRGPLGRGGGEGGHSRCETRPERVLGGACRPGGAEVCKFRSNKLEYASKKRVS